MQQSCQLTTCTHLHVNIVSVFFILIAWIRQYATCLSPKDIHQPLIQV